MSRPAVLFLPGNGHTPVRLEAVRDELRRAGDPFELHELAYSPAASYDALLEGLQRDIESLPGSSDALVYATGIGGLVALSLRARGALLSNPVVLQGAVLWGLERRWFPRLMRLPAMAHLLAQAFKLGAVRSHFASKHFRAKHAREWVDRFFAGYGDAQSFASWFAWLTPALLRELEGALTTRQGALENLEAWWGDRDTVVGPEELDVTSRALGQRIPVRTFPGWGHYPMIDDPGGWVLEVSRVVETAGAPA